MSERATPSPSGSLSRVPYLPGLDGLRAVAVVGVIIYHANHTWLKGGFLGVEVFFVISGYLITLLLVGEHERSGGVDLRQFWLRRARRLLPALFGMMALLLLYITAFYPAVRESTRGDFLGGIFYVSNWYQIVVGQGYASAEAFVPLRHLWSLAVEEQFYLLWPLVMVFVLRRGRRRLPSVGLRFLGAALLIAAVTAVLFPSGFIPAACSAESSNGYWHLFGRCISAPDFLYLGSITRAGGLLLGAGFALLWRPAAIVRGPLRQKGRQLDVLAAVGMVVLVLLMLRMYLYERGEYDAWLFRGGFLLTGVATLLVVAAATHAHAATGSLLGNPVFKWIGTRSYGLYLYHWPIFQIIRKQAQIGLTLPKFVLGVALAALITEASYRYLETPIRKGQFRELLDTVRDDIRYRVAGIAVIAVLALGVVSMATADPQCVGAVKCSLIDESPDTVPTTSVVTTPTVPGDTVVTTTTIPKVPQKYIAIGESVMVGAKAKLQGAGVLVQARESRGPEGTKNAVIQLRDAGDLGVGTRVVIQVGTNGPLNASALDAIMAQMPEGVAGVVFMTVTADKDYIDKNNELINALPSRYSNVTILDWATESAKTTLCPDKSHITCGGGADVFYANLVLGAFGLPALS